jgi:two-component system cell cycle sensor histidine kinase/response regulator CckA
VSSDDGSGGISSLEKAQQALRDSEQRLRQAVRVSHIGIFEHDHVSRAIYLSPEIREIFGLAEDQSAMFGESSEGGQGTPVQLLDFLPPEDRDLVVAAIASAHDPGGDGIYEVEHRHIRPCDGSVRTLNTRAQTMFAGEGAARHPVRTIGAVRDITEEKLAEQRRHALEAQLSQAQKMESIGRLAGGVAHDFNNMLNVILGWSSLALSEIDRDHPLHEALQEIHAAAERSAGLTRQLLAFARRQTVAPKVLDLNDLVAKSLTMLGRLIGEDVQLVWSPGRSLWPIRIDPSQVDQILANLAANARDAIAGVGTLTIATSNATLPAWSAPLSAAVAPGDYVLLRVSDTGSGMSEETRAHIFEPFYTTKPPGQGTGLGLATVYGIVRQNEGAIHLETAVGKGTSVWIYLPRHVGPAVGVEGEAVPEAEGGSETILLVEDEAMMLDLSRTMLEKLGYEVLIAATPTAAMDVAARRDDIDLLFTDIIMPSMSGTDLAALLVKAQPRLKCLFASGHFTHGATQAAAIDEGMHFLQKPFSMRDLAAKVREALERP